MYTSVASAQPPPILAASHFAARHESSLSNPSGETLPIALTAVSFVAPVAGCFLIQAASTVLSLVLKAATIPPPCDVERGLRSSRLVPGSTGLMNPEVTIAAESILVVNARPDEAL